MASNGGLLGEHGGWDALPPTSADFPGTMPPGTVVGQYVVERVLGAGGMGVVVAARHSQLGELVAIKLLHETRKMSGPVAERFAREARQLARLRSEHVVRVLDAGMTPAGDRYLVMEHLVGTDLGRVLRHRGPVAPTLAVDYTLQVCEALAQAHALGIVHRDIKPANFFLTRSADGADLVKVVDFGLAKSFENVDTKLTESGVAFGSPAYMSPEQIQSAATVDTRTDVWSLGVSLYELVSGQLPFASDNVAGMLVKIVIGRPAPLPASAGVPRGLEEVVRQCLQRERDARFGTVAELARALAPFASPLAAAMTAARVDRIARLLSSRPSLASSPGPRAPESELAPPTTRDPVFEETSPALPPSTALTAPPVTGGTLQNGAPPPRTNAVALGAALAVASLVLGGLALSLLVWGRALYVTPRVASPPWRGEPVASPSTTAERVNPVATSSPQPVATIATQGGRPAPPPTQKKQSKGKAHGVE